MYVEHTYMFIASNSLTGDIVAYCAHGTAAFCQITLTCCYNVEYSRLNSVDQLIFKVIDKSLCCLLYHILVLNLFLPLTCHFC